MSHQKSPDRIKVERALQESKEGLTIEALSNACSVPAASVYRVINAMMKYDQVFNTKGQKARNGVYAWNRAKPKIEAAPTPALAAYREPIGGPPYLCPELTREPPRGAASTHAYTLPSHGRPRVAPFSMGSTHGQFACKTL